MRINVNYIRMTRIFLEKIRVICVYSLIGVEF